MIVFRLIKKSLVFLGIRSPQSSEPFHRINLRNSMIALFFVVSTTLMGLFFIYESGSVGEYSSAVYGILTTTATEFHIMSLIWKTKKLYELLDEFDDIIQKRKCSR